MNQSGNIIEVKNLEVSYLTEAGDIHAVNDVSFAIQKGTTFGLVGETGAGKTTTALSMLRLIQEPGEIQNGEILFKGGNLFDISEKEMQLIRGAEISMIFQDPMTALNPVHTIGAQIAEVVRLHQDCSKSEALERAAQMLEKVGIPADRVGDYPHQLSGGMKQRVVIAIALACNPELLIADEPTTALDVTVQAQVLEMINGLKKEYNTAMLLITHDLGIVAETCDTVGIMYAGEIVELGNLEQIFDQTLHPYTKGLFASIPKLDEDIERLSPIAGLMPDPVNLPAGCKFHPRCPYASTKCSEQTPVFMDAGNGHMVRCHFALV